MRKVYQLLFVVLSLLITGSAYAQVSYTENFDVNTGGWTSTGATFSQTATTPCTGAGAVRANLYSSSTATTFTSTLLGSSNGGMVTFNFNYKIIDWSFPNGPTPNPWGTMLVQYATSASGPWTTFHTISSATHTPSANCAAQAPTFNPPPGDLFVRFSGTWSDGDYYFYIDDINITQGAPPACFTPITLGSSNITASAADLTWAAPSSGTPTGYQWELRTSGAGGSGATGLVNSGSTNATTFTASVTGLTSNTAYSLYVRTDCGSGSFSLWEGPHSFTTLCSPFTTFPFFENFNNPGIPSCWSTELVSGTNNWVVGTTSAGGDIGTPFSGTRFISKHYNTSTANLISPAMNLASLAANPGRISVYVYRHNNTVAADVINFLINTSPSTSGATNLMSIYPLRTVAPVEAAAGWYKYTADIPVSFNTAGTVYFIMEGITTAGFSSYDLGIEDFLVEQTPTCEQPTAITISNITTTTADVSWTAPTAGSGPVDYEIYYSTTNTAPTNAATPNVLAASSPSTITSLTPNTTYWVWVRSNCGAGDKSTWSAIPGTFTTACLATNLPYSQDFETATVPNLPSCTSKENLGSGNGWTVSNSPGSGFTSKTLQYVYNAQAANAWFYTQGLNLTGGTSYRISYRYGNNSTFFTEKLEVKYGSAPNSTSMTDLIADHPTINTAAATTATFDFVPATTGVYFIGFHAYSIANQWNLYVDDISVVVTPTCDIPTAITVGNITTTGAEVSWTPPVIGSPVNYHIYYNSTNTAPTGATTPSVTSASAPATLTGLTPATTYYVWMRTNCGGTDVSAWTATAVTFTTLCTSASIPTAVQSFDAAAMPICWSRSLITGSTNWAPATNNDGVPAAFTGARFMGKVYTASDALVVSQPINMTTAGVNGARINVWIYRSTVNNTTDRIRFHVNTTTDLTGATQLLEIFPKTTVAPAVASAGWYNYTADIPSSYNTEPTVYIIGQGTTDGTFSSYGIGFDDFKVEVIPTCNEPTGVTVSNITTTGAQLDWTPPGSGTPVNYQVYYSTTNTAPTGSTTPTVTGLTGTTTNLTGLTAATTYYLWMRTNCGGSDVSAWITTGVTFTTLCNTATIPTAVQSFDATTMPVCWSRSLITGTTNWAPDDNNDGVPSAHTGARFMGKNYTMSDALVISQPINMTSAGSNGARINVWIYRSTANNTTDRIRFHVNTTADLTGAVQLLEIFPKTTVAPTVASAGWYNYTADIPASFNTEPLVYIIAQGTTDGSFSSYGIGFDDFKVETIPTCQEPTSLVVSNTTSTAAQVDWSAPSVGSVTNYGWELRTSGAAGSGATGLVASGTTATTTVNLSSLTAATAYTFYVRTNCISPDASTYASIAVITVPVNDDCANAIQVYKATPQTGTTVGSTPTMAADCGGLADDEVWYKFNADYSGNASIALTAPAAAFDGVIVAYSGACGGFTYIDCADLNGPGVGEVLNLTSLTGGQTYYFRVYGYGTTAASAGSFTVTITGSALPVTMTELKGTAAGATNLLSWTTVTEIKNHGFEIQRSADGKNFSRIAFVGSKAESGNSNTPINYSFSDVRPLGGTNYYRLKQLDKDGQYTYSNIVELKTKASDIRFSSVYPNPATRELNVVISAPSAEKVTIVITDLTGKILLQQKTQLVSGDTQSKLNVQSLAAGTYLIKAVCTNGCETAVHRFVKQ